MVQPERRGPGRWRGEGLRRCEIKQGQGGELLVLDGTSLDDMDLSIVGSTV